MVIGDHDLQSESPGRSHLVHGRDPAVHGDQQSGSGAGELAHRALREPVALVATGQAPDRIGAEGAQGADHHRRGADPVHVVVPNTATRAPASAWRRITAAAASAPGRVEGSDLSAADRNRRALAGSPSPRRASMAAVAGPTPSASATSMAAPTEYG